MASHQREARRVFSTLYLLFRYLVWWGSGRRAWPRPAPPAKCGISCLGDLGVRNTVSHVSEGTLSAVQYVQLPQPPGPTDAPPLLSSRGGIAIQFSPLRNASVHHGGGAGGSSHTPGGCPPQWPCSEPCPRLRLAGAVGGGACDGPASYAWAVKLLQDRRRRDGGGFEPWQPGRAPPPAPQYLGPKHRGGNRTCHLLGQGMLPNQRSPPSQGRAGLPIFNVPDQPALRVGPCLSLPSLPGT